MPFEFSRLDMPDVVLIKPRVFSDERGRFMETYKLSDFSMFGIKNHFVQDNYSISSKGVLRGLHYQKSPNGQGKLVRCIHGSVFDVAVDIRKGSPDFGRWVGAELSGENGMMLYVPPDFAHGFVVLSDIAEVAYKCTKEYSPADERGIIWNDQDIGILWPVDNPLVCNRDKGYPLLRDADL